MKLALPALSRASRVALAALFTSAILLISHVPASAHHASAALPILRYDAEDGQATWPSTLDPAVAEDGYSIGVFDLIYAAPVKLNYTTYAIIPDLASRYVISKDHKTYWFYFRHGLQFSNGDPVTAQDEVWSLTRMLKKSTNSPVAMAYFGHIVGAKKLNDGKTNRLAGVKALGPYVLQVRIDKPIAYFIKTFSYWANKVLDPRVVGNHTPGTYLTNDCSANVGTGPFMFKCRNSSANKSSFYAPGTSPTITLVPNPHYYGRKPKIELVDHFYATFQVGLDAYKANQLDIAVLQGGDINTYKGTSQIRVFPAPSIDALEPNFQAPPFNNVHCRLALSYAIDRNTLDNVVMHRTYRPLYSMVPPPIPAAYAGANNPHYNPTLAKKELAQCPGGIKGVTLVYYKSGTDADNRFSAIQNMLSQVGINIQIKGLPVNDWLTDVSEPQNNTHNTLVELEWGMDFPDPEDFCTLLLRGGETYNTGQFNDPIYNRLVDRADVTLNPTQRVKLYEQAEHLALSTGAWTMIGQVVQYAAVKPWVHGLVAAYGNSYVAPAHDDWANVTVSPH
jgi:ABC-type transport system substrate-binding protein